MSVNAQIVFENPDRVFYSGHLLKGRVTLTVDEDKIVKGLYVRIHGFGHCEWIWFVGKNHMKHETHGNETYIDHRIHLIGSDHADSTDICITPGTHTYPFEYRLPVEIPSSLETKRGSVKYYANCVLDRPSWPIPTPNFPFTVYKPLDLSLDPNIHEPLTMDTDQRFYLCCLLCCWESKPIHMAVTIPKRFFAHNETIDLNVDVKNSSWESVSCFCIKIIQTIVWSANDGQGISSKGKERSEEKEVELVEETVDGLSSGKSRQFECKITVPITPTTDITSSVIFKLSHTLRVSAVIGGCHNDFIFDFPIKIGTNYDRGWNAYNPNGPGRDPIVVQPTAPSSDSGVNEPLLSISGQSNTKSLEYNPPTYEETFPPPEENES